MSLQPSLCLKKQVSNAAFNTTVIRYVNNVLTNVSKHAGGCWWLTCVRGRLLFMLATAGAFAVVSGGSPVMSSVVVGRRRVCVQSCRSRFSRASMTAFACVIPRCRCTKLLLLLVCGLTVSGIPSHRWESKVSPSCWRRLWADAWAGVSSSWYLGVSNLLYCYKIRSGVRKWWTISSSAEERCKL